jgi:hypothetical protein
MKPKKQQKPSEKPNLLDKAEEDDNLNLIDLDTKLKMEFECL